VYSTISSAATDAADETLACPGISDTYYSTATASTLNIAGPQFRAVGHGQIAPIERDTANLYAASDHGPNRQ
jgi:hypothetical protein